MLLTILALLTAVSIIAFVQTRTTHPDLLSCYFVESHLVSQVLEKFAARRQAERADGSEVEESESLRRGA